MRLFLVFILTSILSACSETSPKDMFKYAEGSVVQIRRGSGGSGSGFYVRHPVSGKKVIVTNSHVCGEATNELRILPDDKSEDFTGNVLVKDQARDICIIDAPSYDKHVALPIASKALIPGQKVFAIGHPLGLPLNVAEGLYLGSLDIPVAYPPEFCGEGKKGHIEADFFGAVCVQNMHSYQLTASIYPGNSGGALLNAKGEVVGVVFASGALQGGGSALKLSDFLDVLLSVK